MTSPSWPIARCSQPTSTLGIGVLACLRAGLDWSSLANALRCSTTTILRRSRLTSLWAEPAHVSRSSCRCAFSSPVITSASIFSRFCAYLCAVKATSHTAFSLNFTFFSKAPRSISATTSGGGVGSNSGKPCSRSRQCNRRSRGAPSSRCLLTISRKLSLSMHQSVRSVPAVTVPARGPPDKTACSPMIVPGFERTKLGMVSVVEVKICAEPS
mmetsp:Transcript_45155/g.98185  ORF Transcript_45155/g.98185 Transcript_45155/m.98185 type:complete len:213 (+) Transcript_45155:1060-1698(+)